MVLLYATAKEAHLRVHARDLASGDWSEVLKILRAISDNRLIPCHFSEVTRPRLHAN